MIYVAFGKINVQSHKMTRWRKDDNVLIQNEKESSKCCLYKEKTCIFNVYRLKCNTSNESLA